MKMIVRHETDGYLDEKYDSFGDVAFMLPAGFGTESGPAISALETLQISTTKEAAVIEEKPAVEGSGLAAVKESATTDKISTTEILPATDTPNLPRKTRATQTTDTLSNLLDSLSIADSKSFNTNPTISTTPTKPTTPYKPTTSQTLEIKPLGTPFPPSLMLEIKTRAASKSLNLRETLPQLWISQTPHLVVGYHHSGGWFDRIKVKNMRSSINEWEEMNQETLRKLVGLIKWIVEKVQGVEGKRGTVRFEGGDVIKVMGIAEETNVAISPMMSKTAKKKEKKQKKMMLRRALPDDLYEKWSFTNEHVGEKGFGDGEVNGGGVRLV
jgi:hypothetical protein